MDPEALEHLVEAVGKVIQPEEANRGGGEYGSEERIVRFLPMRSAYQAGRRLRLPPMSEISAQVIRFTLALWVGGTLVVILAAPVIFRMVPSRDAAGEVFGEILRRFEAVKHMLSLLLVVAIFLQLEQTRGFAGQSRVAGVAAFVAVATNVYLAMVLRPRMNYFRMKVGSFDKAPPDDPWKKRFDRLHKRSTRVLVLGWLAAAVALAAGT